MSKSVATAGKNQLVIARMPGPFFGRKNHFCQLQQSIGEKLLTMKFRSDKPDRLLLGWILLTIATAAHSLGQTPAPSATVSSSATFAPAAGALATPAELHPAVRAAGIRGAIENRDRNAVYVQRGDEIWVEVRNFRGWLGSLGDRLPKDHEVKDLILYLDHFPLYGVSPSYSYEYKQATPTSPDGKWQSQEFVVTTIGFSLVRNDDSKTGWSHLLNRPVFQRKVLVSVGFPNGEEIDTEMTPDGKKPSAKDQQVFLTVIPQYRTAFGLLVILSALIAFLGLARRTHIIRDGSAPRRPDGLRPYSLARGQMAFWFFLVIASYFFLWIVTGDMDTLNTSVLGLIGISAGTALGSAFVDSSRPSVSSGNEPTVDVTKPHLEVLAELKDLQVRTQTELETLQKARAAMSESDKPRLEENERKQNDVRERLANYRWQSVYFAWPTWKGVMYDLLAENNVISFHRFQIFVWTLILGIMFIASVYNELAMPQFSATLLGLLGISAGTYVGFKLPESKPA